MAGHLGDRFGRKISLILTLVLMGTATALVGVLPTYAQAGAWAPLLLILLRVLQGFSAGGEWGGAALMSVEHAPLHKRSFFGSFPQVGTPIGMIAATLVLLLFTSVMGKDEFVAWGWRLPFLSSIVLIVIGLVIRRSVEESPVFREMQARRKESSAPIGFLFKHHTKQVLLAALIFMANNAAGYLLIAFFISYGTKTLNIPGPTMLYVCTAAAVSWLLFTLHRRPSRRPHRSRADVPGRLRRARDLGDPDVAADRFRQPDAVLHRGRGDGRGRSACRTVRRPRSTRRCSRPTSATRASSIGYSLGSILGGAFAASIAQWIISTWHQSWGIGVYIAILSVISLAAVTMVRGAEGANLNTTHGV